MRSIEVPGCGGIMLAPRTKDHEAFFEEGKEAFYYNDVNELVEQASKILEVGDKEVFTLRKQILEKVLNQYTYKTLVKSFI